MGGGGWDWEMFGIGNYCNYIKKTKQKIVIGKNIQFRFKMFIGFHTTMFDDRQILYSFCLGLA